MGMNSAPNPSPTIATRTLRSVAMGAAPRRCVGDQNCSQDTAAPGPGQRGANEESPPRVGGLSCPHLLVPTQSVGTRSLTDHRRRPAFFPLPNFGAWPLACPLATGGGVSAAGAGTGVTGNRRVADAQYRCGISPTPMITNWLSQNHRHPTASRLSNP